MIAFDGRAHRKDGTFMCIVVTLALDLENERKGPSSTRTNIIFSSKSVFDTANSFKSDKILFHPSTYLFSVLCGIDKEIIKL